MKLKRLGYELLSLVWHWKDYHRLHVRNVARLYADGLPGNAIFLDRETYVVPPQSSSVTHAVWTRQSAFADGVREDRIFRQLRAGCRALLDLGAAEGYYSALFAATAGQASRIVAVDLSPAMCRLHEEVIEANRRLSGQPIDWTIHQVAITDAATETTLGEGFGRGLVCWYDTDPTRPVQTATLRQFLQETDFTPDFIKIDIESYEYEVVTSSLDWLAEHRPRLHLELHSALMRERNKSPEQLMDRLLEHYRVVKSTPAKYQTAPISRIGLVPRP